MLPSRIVPVLDLSLGDPGWGRGACDRGRVPGGCPQWSRFYHLAVRMDIGVQPPCRTPAQRDDVVL